MNIKKRILSISLLCFVNFLFGFQKQKLKPLALREDPVAEMVFNNAYSYASSVNSNLKNVTKAYQSYIKQIDTVSGLPKTKNRIGIPALLSRYDDISSVKEVFSVEPNIYLPVKEAGNQYLDCLTELKNVYSLIRKYYFYESYKSDNYDEVKRVNPKLMSAFNSFLQAQYDLKKEIITIGKKEGYYSKNYKVTRFSSIPLITYQRDEENENAEECKLGKETAEYAFKQKKYRIISYGLPSFDPYSPYKLYKEKMMKKYGLEYLEIGCVVTDKELCYNKRMRELLNQKFKKDIFDVGKLMDSIRLQQEIKKIKDNFVFKINKIDEPPVFDQGRGGFDIYTKETLNCDLSLQTEKYPWGYSLTIIVEKDGSVKEYYSSMIDPIPVDCKIKIEDLLSKMPKWGSQENIKGLL